MNIVSRIAIAACACVFTTSMAAAGDLPVKTVSPVPYYDWSGFYLGIFSGGAHGIWTSDFARSDNHGHTEQGADGFAIGLYGGYIYQLTNRVVTGIELDIGHAGASQHNNIYDNDTSESKYGMFGSVRGRLGYAFDRLLLFGTVGLAVGNMTNNIQKGKNAGEQIVWEDQTRVGFTAGLGVDYAFTDRWIGRAEYVYTNYGSSNHRDAEGDPATFRNEVHLARVGVSYRF
ncbi:MAG: porin family protein [Alphaproteobacteria bacterium]|nr:porin family protein [Alphaproteobacteria bacterium]